MSPEEFNAAVAEHVMGCEWVRCDFVVVNGTRWDEETWIGAEDDPCAPPPGTRVGQTPPPYSTDIAAAWEVAEKLCDMFDESFSLTRAWDNDMRDVWRVVIEIESGVWIEVDGDTAPMAICLAALKAAGVALPS